MQPAPNPPAAQALCERLGGVLATEIDAASSPRPPTSTSTRSRRPSRRTRDTAGYVEELERRADSLELLEESDDLRPATRSLPKSRASSGSARRTRTHLSPAVRVTETARRRLRTTRRPAVRPPRAARPPSCSSSRWPVRPPRRRPAALALATPAPGLPCSELRHGKVVGERVRDLRGRSEVFTSLIERPVGARGVAVSGGEQGRTDRQRHLRRDLHETIDVLLVAVAAEFAAAPSRRFASGNSLETRRSCTLRARASRHVQRARI